MKNLKLLLVTAILSLGWTLTYGCSQSASHNYVPPVQQPIGTPSPQILVPGP